MFRNLSPLHSLAVGSVFSIFNLLDWDASESHFLVAHKFMKLCEALLVGVFLDKLNSLLDSLCDLVRLIHLIDSQLVFNIWHALTLHLSKLE